MRLIPVIDLMHGEVVRAVGGRRGEYRPIQSRLCSGAKPVEFGRALVEQFGLATAYLADLDAITGHEPAWPIFEQLTSCGLELWIDAGTGDLARARPMEQARRRGLLARIVIGLETLASWEELGQIAGELPIDSLVFSLDLVHGKPLAREPRVRSTTAVEIAEQAIEQGIRSIIVLDLAAVGLNAGPSIEDMLQDLAARFPGVRWIGGGGVRHAEDLARLAHAGCDAALVSSALHNGRITRGDIETLTCRTSDFPARRERTTRATAAGASRQMLSALPPPLP